ncbi:hypothetical protein MnTg04_01588 [bacterium MnTg04]|nr:hypothetical protein MnTg04_01588 [bacterium MnTg04]
MVPGICDKQAVVQGIGQHLARETQLTDRPLLGYQVQIGTVDLKFFHQPADDGIQQIVMPLPGYLANNVSGRVDHHQRRPGASAIGLPDLEILVVNDRMHDLVALYETPDCRGPGFTLEFAGMHADDNQLLSVFLLQAFQIGDDMQAVDTAIGPEIQQYHLAAEFLDA